MQLERYRPIQYIERHDYGIYLFSWLVYCHPSAGFAAGAVATPAALTGNLIHTHTLLSLFSVYPASRPQVS